MARVTQSQLGIQKGDLLIVTKDDGETVCAPATSDPWQLGGHTWVVMIEGISGCYDLCRCKKANPKAL